MTPGTTADAYPASLAYLYERLNYERVGMPRQSADLQLHRMRRLLRALGDPQRGLKIVHIAGTKGKGSTAAMIAAALQGAGLRTGLFCSPHLHRIEERFRIDDQDARPADLVDLVETLRPVVADLDARGSLHGRPPVTFFELTTAMGLLHFARNQADVVVFEVGMGGRLDSTNVVRPVVSVLTSISFDHTRQLGNTLGAIAREKAGIIKRGRSVVSGVRGAEAREQIRRIAAARSSKLYELDTDFDYEFQPPSSESGTGPRGGRVAVRTWRRQWGALAVPLLGPHQAQNAATALAALDVLGESTEIEVGPAEVARGWATLRFPARVEVLGQRPWLIVDGAHNVASAEALAATLRLCFPAGPRTLIFGTTREKDLQGQLRALLPLFERVIATRYHENPRAVEIVEVADAIRELSSGAEPLKAAGPVEALELARRVTPDNGLVCVTGSLFLAAEARAAILGLSTDPAPPEVSSITSP